MNISELKEKLLAYEQQLEASKAQVYRLDGITNFLKFELEQAEKAEAGKSSKVADEPRKLKLAKPEAPI